jgi:hypothetical protein
VTAIEKPLQRKACKVLAPAIRRQRNALFQSRHRIQKQRLSFERPPVLDLGPSPPNPLRQYPVSIKGTAKSPSKRPCSRCGILSPFLPHCTAAKSMGSIEGHYKLAYCITNLCQAVAISTIICSVKLSESRSKYITHELSYCSIRNASHMTQPRAQFF